MPKLTEADCQRRRPVWASLADLFLDTETRPAIVDAAYCCLASGYSEEVLTKIWRHEVSPLLAPNLMSIAGEWAYFDLELLEANILRRKPGFLDAAAAWVNKSHWAEVLRLMGWLRDWPTQQREEVVLFLRHLIWRSLGGFRDVVLTCELEEMDRTRIWEEAAQPLLITLYVKGHDDPLPTILERGRRSLVS